MAASNEGETIEADEPLLEISTDKVDTEVPSPGTGIVQKILVQEGETVDVGTKLAVIAPEGAAPAAEPSRPPGARARRRPRRRGRRAPSAAAAAAAPSAETPAPRRRARSRRRDGRSGNGKTFVSPVVARIAAEHGVDVGSVPGTGQGGRVTKKDILAFIERGAPAAPRAGAARRGNLRPSPPPAACAAPATAAAAGARRRRGGEKSSR